MEKEEYSTIIKELFEDIKTGKEDKKEDLWYMENSNNIIEFSFYFQHSASSFWTILTYPLSPSTLQLGVRKTYAAYFPDYLP